MTPQIGPREVVFETRWQKIFRVEAKFDGFQKEFFVNSFGHRVGLLIVQDQKILLVRQYRLLVNQIAWEIPGGRIDAHETPEQGAIREGLEETCLRCRALKPLLYFHPGLDTFDNPTFLFSCDDFEEAPDQHLHPHEISEKVWVPLTTCLEMVFRQEIVDSLTIAALFAYQLRKDHPEFAQV